MSLETVIVIVVLGNLGCAVLGWIAGRASQGVTLDVAALKTASDDAAEALDEARERADEERWKLAAAASAENVEGELARLVNEDRDA